MVELNPSFSDDGDAVAAKTDASDARAVLDAAPSPDGRGQTNENQATASDATARTSGPDAAPPAGDNAAGVARVAEILAAATSARWPMYLRNAKQILRAAGGFDERRYGFGGLLELLRACQREGLIRLERDRRGGLRIFQGPALGRITAPPAEVLESAVEAVLDAAPVEVIEAVTIPVQPETDDILDVSTVAVVDTTAELLGRAKPRPGRTRAASAASSSSEEPSTARGARKGTRKTAGVTRRASRSKKAAAGTTTENS
jgi:hypothetical protein